MKIAYWIAGILVVAVVAFLIINPPSDNEAVSAGVQVIPIAHASVVLNWGDTVVYADPVGASSSYADVGKPDIVLVTHDHGDHFSTASLALLMDADTTLVVPQTVADKLPASLKRHLVVLKNGDTTNQSGLTITAVPMYNLREEDKNRHPKGNYNGYVVQGGDTRVYIAGDTEDIPEMRGLRDIDIAFVPMNLPYTMSVEKAADAVLAFKPKQVYPYHFRTPTGFSDVAKFKQLVNAGNPGIEVTLANWYPQ